MTSLFNKAEADATLQVAAGDSDTWLQKSKELYLGLPNVLP